MEQLIQSGHRNRIFERGNKNRQGVQPGLQQGFCHAVDRIEPSPLHQGSIKDQRNDRRALCPLGLRSRQVRNAGTWPIDPGAQQRFGRLWLGGLGNHILAIAQEVDGVFRPAFYQIGPKRIVVLIGDSRKQAQIGVGFVIPRKRSKGHAGIGKSGGILFEAIFPIARPAQHPSHHQFRLGGAGVDMQINRHRMLQVHHAGQTQPRWGCHFRAGGREGCQFRIGRRDEHNICRALTEIHRLLPLIYRSGGGS